MGRGACVRIFSLHVRLLVQEPPASDGGEGSLMILHLNSIGSAWKSEKALNPSPSCMKSSADQGEDKS